MSDESKIPDHCICFALSDPEDKDFQVVCAHNHDEICNQCQMLDDIISDIKSAVGTCCLAPDDKSEIEYMIVKALEYIRLWKAHQLRSVNQEKSRRDILDRLDETCVLITQDWAMKVSRKSVRLVWKKGDILAHFSGSKERRGCNQQLEGLTLVHVVENAQQDSNTVTSIMHDVVKAVKKAMPGLATIYYRQDNAGCNHSADTILGMDTVAATGVKIRRMDLILKEAKAPVTVRQLP